MSWGCANTCSTPARDSGYGLPGAHALLAHDGYTALDHLPQNGFDTEISDQIELCCAFEKGARARARHLADELIAAGGHTETPLMICGPLNLDQPAAVLRDFVASTRRNWSAPVVHLYMALCNFRQGELQPARVHLAAALAQRSDLRCSPLGAFLVAQLEPARTAF